MIKWLKNRILKSIIKDLVKEMPVYKAKALALIEEHKDEIIQRIKDEVKKVIREFLASKSDSNS